MRSPPQVELLQERESADRDRPKRRRRLLFVVNVGWFFISHRLPIAIAARDAGYEVHIAAGTDPNTDDNTIEMLTAHGFEFHELGLSRSGASPIRLLCELAELVKLYRSVMPELVHLVTLKPVLLGGLAARICRIGGVVLAVPGRGSVFSSSGIMATLRRWIAVSLYRLAYRKRKSRVILQNEEDRAYFVSRGIFAPMDARLIRGSGVDLASFSPSLEPDGVFTVVFASRMLKEKGAADFVSCAALLKSRGMQARFVLVGEPDHGNPQSHSRDELDAWNESGIVEWWGFHADMNAVFARAHVVCLPTYYGEGVPKVLIEAAACCRPIVTTDTAGCRDIVRHGENGLLVRPRDVLGLADAIQRLRNDADLRIQMGRRGREIVETEFTTEIVARQTLGIYSELDQ